MTLEELIAEIRQSAKYRHISDEVIRRVGAQEIQKYGAGKAAVKHTKTVLHQIGGAYFDASPRYPVWLNDFVGANEHGDAAAWRQCAEGVMAAHASTRERLPILTEFYTQIFALLPPVHSVLDIACGLNPLAVPWMPLAGSAEYHACDIYTDQIAFLNAVFALTGMPELAAVRDVISHAPTQTADLALVLKFLPLLDQWDRNAALPFLQNLNACHILISFPTRSLSGRGKGMAAHYETRFYSLIDGENWNVQRLAFPGELCFLIAK